jgi:hypothetical protein
MAEEDERRRSENFDEWLGDLRQQHKVNLSTGLKRIY